MSSYVLRCATCGHIGNRVFAPDLFGRLRDVLGGASGVTPDMTTCGCGGRDFDLVAPDASASYWNQQPHQQHRPHHQGENA